MTGLAPGLSGMSLISLPSPFAPSLGRLIPPGRGGVNREGVAPLERRP
jgi:hypothetical protein